MADPVSSSSSKISGSGGRKDEAIDDMIQRVGIEDDEFDDLVFEDEEDAPKEGIKWMALAKVHTTNYFSPQTFEQHMRVAWSPAKEIHFQLLEDGVALPESDETDSLSDNNKRLRKDGAVSPSSRSAGSFEEHVREQ
ncbi:hypothetical protein QYE76_041103 [Lolium multiflorum]|uniref:Uncharacterized protein n=1 Tax=Lolium multiflorum TaxID=4521 RepID=A0AAD8TC94_LOLMU|nr:hypothetical protein QYE76_041103 [Lolium multiflorum]